jgi:hypothetical protein
VDLNYFEACYWEKQELHVLSSLIFIQVRNEDYKKFGQDLFD